MAFLMEIVYFVPLNILKKIVHIMYESLDFKAADPQSITQFIRQYPLALICGTAANGYPVATQLPVLMEESEGSRVVFGHMMRNSDHYRAFTENPNALFVFTGPDAYISANWYDRPGQASTWNYMSVHLRGRLEFLDNDALTDIMQKTTLHFEDYKEDSPVVFNNLSPEYRNQWTPHIVGFKMVVEAEDHVFKLSQNQPLKTRQRIIEELKGRSASDIALANAMETFSKEQ